MTENRPRITGGKRVEKLAKYTPWNAKPFETIILLHYMALIRRVAQVRAAFPVSNRDN